MTCAAHRLSVRRRCAEPLPRQGSGRSAAAPPRSVILIELPPCPASSAGELGRVRFTMSADALISLASMRASTVARSRSVHAAISTIGAQRASSGSRKVAFSTGLGSTFGLKPNGYGGKARR